MTIFLATATSRRRPNVSSCVCQSPLSPQCFEGFLGGSEGSGSPLTHARASSLSWLLGALHYAHHTHTHTHAAAAAGKAGRGGGVLLCAPAPPPRSPPRAFFSPSSIVGRHHRRRRLSTLTASESRCFSPMVHHATHARPAPTRTTHHAHPHAPPARHTLAVPSSRGTKERRKRKTEFENQKSRASGGGDGVVKGVQGKKRWREGGGARSPVFPGDVVLFSLLLSFPSRGTGHAERAKTRSKRKRVDFFLNRVFSSLFPSPPHANRSSLTVSDRPSSSVPVLAAMAASAAAVETKRTVP